jgi:hypothetical protein
MGRMTTQNPDEQTDAQLGKLLVSAILLSGWSAESPRLGANSPYTQERVKDAVDVAEMLIAEVTRRA